MLLLTPLSAFSQDKKPVEGEIVAEGLVSYGNFRVFASGRGSELSLAGLEYDRNSHHHLLGAQADYVVEILPVVLLSEPVTSDIWGNPLTNARQIVPGIGISPLGVHLQWLSNKRIMPFFTAKGGGLVFSKKALSSEATYANFSMQGGFGLQARLTDRFGLRVGLFNYLHFSNAYVVPVDPGLDVMSATLGLSYHLGNK
jgi:hypothetical protein